MLSNLIKLRPIWSSSFTQVRNRSRHGFKPYYIGPEGKYRRLRGLKTIKVDLPDFNKFREEKLLSPEEARSAMKKKGIVPPRMYTEKPISVACTNLVFEAYVPPEGDGKVTLASKEGAKQRAVRAGMKAKSLWAIRRLRSFEDEWDPYEFGQRAFDIYLKAHEALANRDEDLLHQLVTEHCYPVMTFHTERTTIRWKYIDTVEKPRTVHVRIHEIIEKNNEFCQATVRFHTRQTLAVYDRFGLLMFGNENVVKDVLEYVVFEKHISNTYGQWRIHSKIIPEWMPPRQPINKTFVKPPPPPPLTEKEIQAKEELKKRQERDEVVDEKELKQPPEQGPTPSLA